MNKAPYSPVETARKKRIFNRAFSIPTYSGKVVVIHNANVGSWPGNRGIFAENDNIQIDKNGNLCGYVPLVKAQKAEIKVNLAAGDKVFDWKSGKEIQIKDNRVTVELLPGGGTMLFIGTPQEFHKLQQTAK